MIRLRHAYIASFITTGFILVISFLWTLPDGKLHLIFCDVGQGDAAYVVFPDGRDMLVDGGPNNAVIGCLGRHMPFWDRTLDMVVMTHPQKDHMQGLITVLDRYRVGLFLRGDVENETEGYQKLIDAIRRRAITVRMVREGDRIRTGDTVLSFIWPSDAQIAKGKGEDVVMGVSSDKPVVPKELNDYSLVFFLRYGSFDALFTGDADQRVEANYTGRLLADNTLEVLKVPHHGSRTGMTDGFISWLRPKVAMISVGKNSYGHPTKQALDLLGKVAAEIHRTDREGDIEVVSDGKAWTVKTYPSGEDNR